jgi:hypothetical protein
MVDKSVLHSEMLKLEFGSTFGGLESLHFFDRRIA